MRLILEDGTIIIVVPKYQSINNNPTFVLVDLDSNRVVGFSNGNDVSGN